MRNIFLSAAIGLSALTAGAIAPMWTRDVRISPDGKQIAFSYKGDIYTVSTQGGSARRITAGDSYESNPVWSPDGKRIAYASTKNGGKDVYISASDGSNPQRLTYNSAKQTPEGFTPDGRNVIFSATIQDQAESVNPPFGRLSELYTVPADGGRIVQLLDVPGVNISVLPDGKILYEEIKGMEDKWRKHHTSSVTRDIWLYNPADGSYKNLTAHAGEDRWPAANASSGTWYFLSERDGDSFNVYSSESMTPGAPIKKLTDFSGNPVRFLSVANDGTLAFAYDGEIYTMGKGGKPVKMPIDVTEVVDEEITAIPFSGASGGTISNDGKQLAFTVRGEVFVTSSEYPSTKQITHTPAQEGELSWGADGRTLYYSSLRDGHYNIYKASIARKEDPNFSNATLIDETAIFPADGIDRSHPVISPDGKKMAFVYDRNRLMVMDLASKKVTTLTKEPFTNYRNGNADFLWSPDSKRLVMTVMNPSHEPYGDISIVDAITGEMTPVTRSGYFDENPRWSADGNAVIWMSDRYGMRSHASWGSEYDVMMAFLNKEAYDKFRLSEEDYALQKEVEDQQKKDAKKEADVKKDTKKKGNDKGKKEATAEKEESSKGVALEPGIEDRIVRLTPNSTQIADFVLSKDGETLYYLAAFEGEYDLWKANLRKGDVSIAKKVGMAAGIETDKDGNLYLLGRQARRFNPKSSELKTISTSGKVKIDLAKEREAMLDYVEREAKERFLLPEMPVDWENYVATYRKFLPHINNNYDFADMLSELLGEINVSHSGGRYTDPSAKEPTASLGLLFDMTSNNPGLTVDEVIEGGPFDRATSKVAKGDIVIAVNGESVTADSDWAKLLNDQVRKKTLVSFRNPKTGKEWDEVVLPISSGATNGLLYKRWVKHNEKMVDELSGGRLGYVHIQSMDDESFRKVYSKLLGQYIDKEGIVIDTRWNGGGRLHEDIEVLFSGEKYVTQEMHGRKSSEMPSRRWNKPSIMIICEANYSNAHGTPWVYKHKNLGKLVGMPVPGTMSSVNWIRLQDPSLVFGIPVTAFRTNEGVILENTQLEPDIKVANTPVDLAKGKDRQIEAAVQSILKDIDAKK